MTTDPGGNGRHAVVVTLDDGSVVRVLKQMDGNDALAARDAIRACLAERG